MVVVVDIVNCSSLAYGYYCLNKHIEVGKLKHVIHLAVYLLHGDVVDVDDDYRHCMNNLVLNYSVIMVEQLSHLG